MKDRIVTFGELMLRLSKTGHMRLSQGDYFTSTYGGSEANVAVSLATQGDEVAFITRLPDSPVGQAAAQSLMQLGVDTSSVAYTAQHRLGTYYLEPAAGMRAPRVVYDRSDSACASVTPGQMPWAAILQHAGVLHVSGITPAISQSAADTVFEALDVADSLGVTVSFDINYRKNLWRYAGADARATLCKMLSRCDVMFGDAIEFEYLFQRAQPPYTPVDTSFEMQTDEYAEWFSQLQRQFPRCRTWLMGMRRIVGSSRHLLTALLWDDRRLFSAPIIDVDGVIDPSGVGDAFMGALLHARTAFSGRPDFQLCYSLAAAALKNTIPGDFNLSTEDEILDFLRSPAFSGAVPAL